MPSIEFPLLHKQTALGIVSDPRIPVVVRTARRDVEHTFLIDTGAYVSVSPRRLAQQIGLDWDELPPINIRGVGQAPMSTRL